MNDYLALKAFFCRCKRLLGEDFVAPIDDEEHLLFFLREYQRHKVALGWRESLLQVTGLPMSSLRDLMQCENVGSVA
jgi:hypothetical protein